MCPERAESLPPLRGLCRVLMQNPGLKPRAIIWQSLRDSIALREAAVESRSQQHYPAVPVGTQ